LTNIFCFLPNQKRFAFSVFIFDFQVLWISYHPVHSETIQGEKQCPARSLLVENFAGIVINTIVLVSYYKKPFTNQRSYDIP